MTKSLSDNPYIFLFYSFPKSIWGSIYSTNIIESFNKHLEIYKMQRTIPEWRSGKLLTDGNGIVGIVGDEGNFAESSKIEKKKEMEGAVAVMRNGYFDIALKKPYLIVKYVKQVRRKLMKKVDWTE